MTLLEMAEYVSDKVRQSDAAAQERCKKFLRRRHEMIWNEALWRASVWRHDFTWELAPSFSSQPPFANYWSFAGGVVGLPPTVDRVLALRREDAGVAVTQMEELFRCGVDEFAQEGTPVKFAVLPAAVVDFQRLTDSDIQSESITFTGAAADAEATLRMKFMDIDGEEREAGITLDATGAGAHGEPYARVILSITKEVTTADILMEFDTDDIVTLAAADTAAKRYPRIRLLPTPTADTAFKCLVKKKATPMTADADEVELQGVENALMAFAQADMLQHARQYAKAMEVSKEALGLLEQFKRMEVVQQATRQRIVPEVMDQGNDWPESKGWFS